MCGEEKHVQYTTESPVPHASVLKQIGGAAGLRSKDMLVSNLVRMGTIDNCYFALG